MAFDRGRRNGVLGDGTGGSDGLQYSDRDHGGIHRYQVVAATAAKAVLTTILAVKIVYSSTGVGCCSASVIVQLSYSIEALLLVKEKNMFDLIGQLIGGLIVGILARLLLPGKEALPAGALGWLLTALIGIAGAFIGGFIAKSIWASGNYSAGWIMSILGAIILLLLVRLIFGRANAT